MAEQRQPRYGEQIYAVRVSQAVDPSGELYTRADSVTVGPSGALFLAVEVDPIEDEDPDHPSGIENVPNVVLAAGQWYSAFLLDPETRWPYFDGVREEVERRRASE